MKQKTKAVGGSPTSAGAQDFTNFLTGGLTSGNFGGNPLSNARNAIGQTMGMGGAINKLLSGNVGDPMTLTNYFKQGNGMANFAPATSNFQSPNFNLTNFNSPGTFSSAYNNPNFQGVNLQQLSAQAPGAANIGSINGGYNSPGFISPNLTGPQQISAQNIGTPDFQSAFNQVNQTSGYNLDDIRSIMNQDLNTQLQNQRASLQGTGTGFMSSAGALGEELLRRDAPSRLGLTLSQIGDTKAQQALSLLGLQNQVGAQNAGNQLQASAFNQQAGMNFNDLMLNAANLQNQFNLGNSQFGANLGLQAGTQNLQAQLQNQGLAQQGFSLGNDARSQMNNFMLQAANQGNQFGLANAQNQAQFAQGAAGLNADTMNQLNQLMLQQGLAGNQFNQGNAQFGAGQDLQAQLANLQNQLQNQQLGNQYSLGLGGLYNQFQNTQLGAQQNTLGMLFNAFNQLNALGTPQAQIAQQPSMFQQITGAVGNIAGAAAPFFL